jgi:hypothetical protein
MTTNAQPAAAVVDAVFVYPFAKRVPLLLALLAASCPPLLLLLLLLLPVLLLLLLLLLLLPGSLLTVPAAQLACWLVEPGPHAELPLQAAKTHSSRRTQQQQAYQHLHRCPAGCPKSIYVM